MIAFTVQKIKVSSGANAEKRTMKMEAKTGAEKAAEGRNEGGFSRKDIQRRGTRLVDN